MGRQAALQIKCGAIRVLRNARQNAPDRDKTLFRWAERILVRRQFDRIRDAVLALQFCDWLAWRVGQESPDSWSRKRGEVDSPAGGRAMGGQRTALG
jgi:hypothetical protein